MTSPPQSHEATIAALQAQRAALGDAVVDAAVAGLRAQAAAASHAASEAAAQQLRQVSILFMDLVGSTQLAQQLDPEETSAVMDDALARGTAIVRLHNGRVLQYAGDNLLAAFGAEHTREDDAECAVRCGLALLDLGRLLQAEVLAAHGHHGLQVRVGVHTGDVLLGGGVDAEATIRGSAVNTAARMEQSAPAGALRISHTTYTQVRGLFEMAKQPPLVFKGLDTPVQTYLVQRALPRSFHNTTRGVEGLATRMIGRSAELAVLQARFKALFSLAQTQTVLVVADAGMGKSRLLHEFQAWAAAQTERFEVFKGRAIPPTQNQPYGLLRDIVARRFEIVDDDTLDVAQAKLEQGLVPLFLPHDGPELALAHTHLLGHLLGISWQSSPHLRGILDDPQQIRNRALHAAVQLFKRVAALAPVVLLLEDLHWADEQSLDFVHKLQSAGHALPAQGPMWVLAFTRSTLFERRADWHRPGEQLHIELKPLDAQASQQLADELLKRLPQVPAALQTVVVGNAEGNPFFMEELVKMLIDQGTILVDEQHTNGSWTVNVDRLLSTQVPATLTGVLQARLDGLPAAEKRALQEASVIGMLFWDQALFALDPSASTALPALVARALALLQTTPGALGLREYAFRHHILHQVTYDTVLKRHKRALHAQVAQWLKSQTDHSTESGLRAGEFLGPIAEHFEAAGDVANATEFHTRAAEHAKARFAHRSVLSHVQRALALLNQPRNQNANAKSEAKNEAETEADTQTDAALRWRLLAARADTLDLLSKRTEQGADTQALVQLAQTLNDNSKRALAAARCAGLAMRMADWPAQARHSRDAIAFAALAGEHEQRLRSTRVLSAALAMQSDFEASLALGQQALAEARQLRMRAVEASQLNSLGVILGMQGRLTESLALTRQALHIWRGNGNRRSEAIGLLNLGMAWLNLGDLAQADTDLSRALQAFKDTGEIGGQGNAQRALSLLALWRGDAAQALARAQAALDIALAGLAPDMQVEAWLQRAHAELALGQRAAADSAAVDASTADFSAADFSYTQAQEVAQRIDHAMQPDASAGRARVALAQGNAQAAHHHLQAVLSGWDTANRAQGTDQPRWIEFTCYQVLRELADPGAGAWLARAHQALLNQAQDLDDAAARQRFFDNIPQHRDIMAAWSATAPPAP